MCKCVCLDSRQREPIVNKVGKLEGHLSTVDEYLFRKPRAEERHVISVGVRVDGAERVGADSSNQGENTA